MIELKSRGWIDPGRLVSHRLPFEDVEHAYEMYETQLDEVVKVVLSL